MRFWGCRSGGWVGELKWTALPFTSSSLKSVAQRPRSLKLVPTLKPNDIVVMDHLRAHKVAGVAEGDCGSRRNAALPAAVFARSQPDRDALQQIQGVHAQARRAHRRRRPLRHSFLPPLPQGSRMRQLFQACRLCFPYDRNPLRVAKPKPVVASGTRSRRTRPLSSSSASAPSVRTTTSAYPPACKAATISPGAATVILIVWPDRFSKAAATSATAPRRATVTGTLQLDRLSSGQRD